MFLRMPFSLTADLQTRTVHDKVHRAVWQTPGTSVDVYCSIPAGHGRVIRAGQIQIHYF